jgi:hypothetical protein
VGECDVIAASKWRPKLHGGDNTGKVYFSLFYSKFELLYNNAGLRKPGWKVLGEVFVFPEPAYGVILPLRCLLMKRRNPDGWTRFSTFVRYLLELFQHVLHVPTRTERLIMFFRFLLETFRLTTFPMLFWYL